MNWLDIIIIIALAIAVLVSLWIGIIKTILSLAGVVVGVILAGRLYTPLSEQLSFIPQPTVARIVAFAIILIGVMVIAAVLAKLLKWATSVMMLGWINRLGGAALGLLLGAITFGALLAAWVKFFGITETILDSIVANVLLDHFPLVLALLPDEFDVVRSFFQ